MKSTIFVLLIISQLQLIFCQLSVHCQKYGFDGLCIKCRPPFKLNYVQQKCELPQKSLYSYLNIQQIKSNLKLTKKQCQYIFGLQECLQNNQELEIDLIDNQQNKNGIKIMIVCQLYAESNKINEIYINIFNQNGKQNYKVQQILEKQQGKDRINQFSTQKFINNTFQLNKMFFKIKTQNSQKITKTCIKQIVILRIRKQQQIINQNKIKTKRILITCDANCLTCDTDPSNCTSCASGLYYLNNVCYSSCPASYFEDGLVCSACDSKCQQCTSSATDCTSCTTSGVDQAFLDGSSCVVNISCPVMTYAESSDHTCSACNVSCGSCEGNTDNCTSCASGLYYLNNVCYVSCPISYFQSSDQCLACDVRCQICDIFDNNCTLCVDTGTYQSYLIPSNFLCVIASSCPSTTYPESSTHICQDCDSSVYCKECSGSPTFCIQCLTDYYLYINDCVSICPSQFYEYNGTNGGQCLSCNPFCYQCDGPDIDQCNECQSSGSWKSYLLATQKKCYQICPQGYFEQIADHTCQECDISCLQCEGNPQPCSVCNQSYSYYPINQSCLIECPSGWFSDEQPPLAYNVCQQCSFECLQCYGPTRDNCTSCDYDSSYRLSGDTCDLDCLTGYGPTDHHQICVKCGNRCVDCYNQWNNCSSCYPSGGKRGFMYIRYPSSNSGRCYHRNCFDGYYGDLNTNFCEPCNPQCETCKNVADNCTSCVDNFYFLDFECLSDCPDGYFIQSNTNCTPCLSRCLICEQAAYNCTQCNPNTPAFYYDMRCYIDCPDGFYESIEQNYTCQACHQFCAKCDGYPQPCTQCLSEYFYFEDQCYQVCPKQQYFQDKVTMECKKCSEYCVKLTISMQFEDSLSEAIIINMTFSENLDFETFPMEDFQTFSFDDSFYQLQMFDFQYTVTQPNQYSIRIVPNQYIIMYNVQITVIVNEQPQINYQAANQRPFSQTVYTLEDSLLWSLIETPDLSEQEKQTLRKITNMTDTLDNFTSTPGIQQIIKTGIFSWLAPGIQITSCMLLVNGILPRHLYQGIRMFAVFVFYQVPRWQKDAQNSRYIFDQKIIDLIPDAPTINYEDKNTTQHRLLKQMQPEWRFRRTGWSMYFIIDTYTQIVVILISWIVLLIVKKCVYKKQPFHKNVGRAYTVVHKIHQVSILYLMMTTVLQWIYYGNSQEYTDLDWSSLLLSIIMLFYFLGYQLYIYFDLFQYPQATIGTQSYLQYGTKYSTFLSKIRYEQYSLVDGSIWSPKIWFRTYNYHILSFYKKMLMMISLPLFHQYPYVQIISLITLQSLQIARFCLTWPYASKIRNFYKLILQIVLLLIMIGILVQEKISVQLMITRDKEKLAEMAQFFNTVGWIILILVFSFNIVIIAVMVIDLWRDCWKGGSLYVMDQIRKEYYWQKVHKYECDNEDIQRKTISKWVRLGNLNEQLNVHEKSKYMPIKIQQIQIQKIYNFFKANIIQATNIHMKRQNFIKQENLKRLSIQDKIHRIIQITKTNYQKVYKIITNIYQKLHIQSKFKKAEDLQIVDKTAFKKIEHKKQVIIETILNVDLTQYRDGGKVLFYKNHIIHKITLLLDHKKLETLTIKQNIQGLPLDINQLFCQQQPLKQKQQKYQRYKKHNAKN